MYYEDAFEAESSEYEHKDDSDVYSPLSSEEAESIKPKKRLVKTNKRKSYFIFILMSY